MTLEDIKQLTLRDILHLTEDKFLIYVNKHIYENHENYDRNTFELVTVDLSVSDYDLTQDFISIKVMGRIKILKVVLLPHNQKF